MKTGTSVTEAEKVFSSVIYDIFGFLSWIFFLKYFCQNRRRACIAHIPAMRSTERLIRYIFLSEFQLLVNCIYLMERDS